MKKIVSGQKTIEVRKTAPKKVPFKCYIYCTNGEKLFDVRREIYLPPKVRIKPFRLFFGKSNGALYPSIPIVNRKVIGEFVCDGIAEFESEFHDDNSTEQLRRVWYDEDDGERDAELFAEDGEPNYLCTDACLTWYELKNYVGIGDRTFYGLHISELKIYDKPKELGEFYTKKTCNSCKKSGYESTACMYDEDCKVPIAITRAPQSWQYVEEL